MNFFSNYEGGVDYLSLQVGEGIFISWASHLTLESTLYVIQSP